MAISLITKHFRCGIINLAGGWLFLSLYSTHALTA